MNRYRMKMGTGGHKVVITIMAILISSYAYAQGNEIVFPAFKPTLSGYKNNAFVEMGKKGVFFWKKDEPEYKLVAAMGGMVWGRGAGIKIGKNGVKIGLGETHMGIHIDGETYFTGNLDYEGSVYTFIGEVRLLEHAFKSNSENPLVFTLVKDKGLVYVKGVGTVTKPDGRKIILDNSK